MFLSSIGPVVSEEKMFENVDRQTDYGVIGILIAHILAFDSGELKYENKRYLIHHLLY